MKIDDWHIDGYGVHHDLAATDLPTGLTVVNGPNEAGKSTLQDFLVGMLFGFTPSNRADHHAPLRGGTYGGRLLVTDDEGASFTIHRGSRRSSLRITGPDGPVDDAEAELRRLLGGATRELYLALFAVHTDELDELKALSDDQVRDRVFSAGILGAGRTAQAALAQLGAERDELWKPGGRSADKYRLRRLRDELTAARTELADVRRQATGLPGLLHRIGTVEADRRRANEARSDLQDRRSLLFVVSNQWPTWAEAAEARGALDQLGIVEPVAPGAGVALQQLVERRDDLRSEADAATELLAQATAAAAALEVPGPALAHRRAIATLAATLPVEEERAATIARLTDEVAGLERELTSALAAIGPDATEAWLDDHPLDATATSDLRRTAEAVRTTEAQLAATREAARRAIAAHEGDLAEQEAVEAALAERTSHPLDRARTAVEHATTLAALLTQRDLLAHRIAVAERPAPPAPPAALPAHLAPALVAAAVVAIVGGGAAAASGAPAIGAIVALLGLALAGLAVTTRRAGRGREAEAAAPATAPSDLAHELAELDRSIQPLLATFRLDARPTLAEASNLRVRAEQFAHDATQLERDRLAAAERRAALDARSARLAQQAETDEQAASTALDDARAAWATWIDAHDLPHGSDPTAAAELLDAIGRARAHLRTLRSQRAALASATAAQAAATARVVELVATTGLTTEADPATAPLAVVAELDATRRRAEAAQQAVAEQDVAVRAAHDHQERARARAEAAQRELEALLAQLDATSVPEAQERIDRAELAAQLRRTITQADRDLRTSIGPDEAKLDAARALLTRADPVRWTHELDEFDQHLRAIDERVDDLTTELAHLTRERDDLERSSDVATAELKVADLEAQLAEAVTRWATVVTAHRVVEATLARYQRERQPDVVKRAAAHFAQITDGRYPRLEVRDREIVAIDQAEREVKAHELSKGATQQLYLCMRFALAESYARTTELPLLLDDIAAHADDGRHPRLAEVLATVAASHQVLVFTGHDRTVAQLRAASPTARVIELQPSAPARRIGLAAG